MGKERRRGRGGGRLPTCVRAVFRNKATMLHTEQAEADVKVWATNTQYSTVLAPHSLPSLGQCPQQARLAMRPAPPCALVFLRRAVGAQRPYSQGQVQRRRVCQRRVVHLQARWWVGCWVIKAEPEAATIAGGIPQTAAQRIGPTSLRHLSPPPPDGAKPSLPPRAPATAGCQAPRQLAPQTG